jgi:hypothetical protein
MTNCALFTFCTAQQQGNLGPSRALPPQKRKISVLSGKTYKAGPS